mgnify:CR=1 FL=1
MNYEMLDRNKLNELDAYIESFEDKPSHLIMILHRAQFIRLSAKGIADLCS